MKSGWIRGAGRIALWSGLLLAAGCEQKDKGAEGPSPEEEREAAPVEVAATPDREAEGKAVLAPVAEPDQESAGEPEAKAVPAEAEAEAEVPAPAPAKPRVPWSLAEAGFAARLPQDVELYADTRRLTWLWEWLGKSGAMEELEKFMAKQEAKNLIPAELAETLETGSKIVPLLFGEEAFVSVRGLAWSWDTGVGINQGMYEAMGEAMTKGVVTGDLASFLSNDTFSKRMSEAAAKWMEKNLEKVDGNPQVAVYAGGRVDGEKRAEVAGWIKKLLGKAADDSEKLKAIEFEEAGASWSGFEIGIQEFEGFHLERAAPQGIEEETWRNLLGQIVDWSLVVVCAEVGEYVVLAAGNGKESIVLAEAPETSLATREGFKFFEQYDVHSLLGTLWAGEDLIESMHSGSGYLPLFEGIEKGLKGSPGLKRGKGMAKMLSEFNSLWRARQSGTAHEWVGAVFLEDGLRAETRGGWDAAGLDLETPLRFAKAFAGLEQPPLVRAHWKQKRDYLEQGHKQVDAGLRFLKLAGEEAMEYFGESAENEGEDELVERFGRWKRDLTKGIEDIANGYRDHFSKAFGEESAFVMDLQGKMIPAVGIDEDILKEGRIPRAALVRPVVKREALTESWEIWNRALTNLFGIMAEGMDQPIPFPDTMTAEKDDLRTYFFPFPFATDDFLPSVSVSDDLFILGSSKKLSENLYAASLEAKGGAVEAGLWVDIRTEGLWDFCEAWLDVYEKRKKTADEIEEEERLKEGDDGEVGPKPEKPADELGNLRRQKADLDAEVDEARRTLEAEWLLDEGPKALEEAQRLLDEGPKDEARKLFENELKLVPSEPPVSPEDPNDPGIPQGEFENPLLKELMKEPEGGAPKIEVEEMPFKGEEGALKEALEAADEEAGAGVQPEELNLEEVPSPLSLDFYGLPDPETLRGMLEKVRRLRGLRYHRWSEDGVPRSSLSVDWPAG